MGLDITAISKARFRHKHNDTCGEKSDHHRVFSYPDHIARLDGMKIGCYMSNGCRMDFDADCYSAYGNWRMILSFIAFGVAPNVIWENYTEYAGKPFVELINMADNRGTIGPMTSRKLASDFEALRDSVERKLREVIERPDITYQFENGMADLWYHKREDLMQWWLTRCDQWHEAFVLASDDGFVIFH
ncbi:TPA: hypothetical protein DF272_01790 [Candidatus Falkowbacteria bacterium]|nr:hypothetical protein [Candidatus Falkowbacteria bacterium]